MPQHYGQQIGFDSWLPQQICTRHEVAANAVVSGSFNPGASLHPREVRILKRAGLERAACSCYAAVRREFDDWRQLQLRAKQP